MREINDFSKQAYSADIESDAESVRLMRELDAEIAEKVMGRVVMYQAGNISDVANADGTIPQMWVGHPKPHGECAALCERLNAGGGRFTLQPLPNGNPEYSTDIEAAFEVVDELRHRGVWTQIQTFLHTTQVRVEMGVPSSETQEWGATAAEAICNCALKAVAKWPEAFERDEPATKSA